MTPRRRYERLQFWMEDINGDWISFSLGAIAPSDLAHAKAWPKTWYKRSVVGVGVRQ